MNSQEKDGVDSKCHQAVTPPRRTDFSIESLLKKEPDQRPLTFGHRNDKTFAAEVEDVETRLPFLERAGREYESDQESSLSPSSPETVHPILGGTDNHRFLGLTEDDLTTYSWLSCTRFKPPKLTRSRKRVGCKRYGRGPRIPFAPQQIAVLESTFSKSQYLSSDCIHSLADTLHLSETRVKIWFQNRRARYRREKEASSSAQTHGEDGLAHFRSDHHARHHSSIQQYQQHSDDAGSKQAIDLGQEMSKGVCAHFLKSGGGGPTAEDLTNTKHKLPMVPDFLYQQLQHYRQVQEFIFQQEQMRCGNPESSIPHPQGNYSSNFKQLYPAASSILQSVLQSSSSATPLFQGIQFQAKGLPNPADAESQANPTGATTIEGGESQRFIQYNHAYPHPCIPRFQYN